MTKVECKIKSHVKKIQLQLKENNNNSVLTSTIKLKTDTIITLKY